MMASMRWSWSEVEAPTHRACPLIRQLMLGFGWAGKQNLLLRDGEANGLAANDPTPGGRGLTGDYGGAGGGRCGSSAWEGKRISAAG